MNAWTDIEGYKRGVIDIKDTLDSGYYSTHLDGNNQPLLYKKELLPADIINFTNSESTVVLNEIDNFWKSKHKYDKYKLVYKRGYILWGPPGSGKSSIVRLIIDDIINRDGIAIEFNLLKAYMPCMQILRKIHPDKKVVVLMEDVEEIIRSNNESSVLNVLDGANQFNNIIYVATTNYPERLGARFINRPSRFDKRFFIGYPDKNIRKCYLEHLISKNGNTIDIDRWVDDTAGFSIAHLKELFVVVNMLENDYDESLSCLRTMIDVVPDSIDDSDERGELGFYTGK